MARVKKTEETTEIKNNINSKKEYIHAVGRRREAVARIRLYTDSKNEITWGNAVVKKGDIVVNEKLINLYFPGEVAKAAYNEPFRITNTQNKFAATIRASGGGNQGQLDASVLAIARALIGYDASFRSILKKKGFLTRDARIRERRKVGTGGKARRKKQSPKR